jgi:WD40 repeat protein
MFSNDDKKLYTGGKNGDIVVFETITGKILNNLNFHNDAVRKILPSKSNFFITISDDNSSLVFSDSETVVGQIFFSTNAKSIDLDENKVDYYVSTDIGELIKISPLMDALNYQTQSANTNFDQLLIDLENEIENIEFYIKETDNNQGKLLFWTLFRQYWLDTHKTKFSNSKILLSLYDRLRKNLDLFSEKEITKFQKEVENYLNKN